MGKNFLLTFCFLIIFWIGTFAQDSIKNCSDKLVVVFAGDIMGHDGQISGAYIDSTGTYDYEPTFRYIKDYIDSADLAISNLEVTLAGKPYKGYPQFSSPDELALAAQNAGFDIMVTSNNHALDRGEMGVKRTIEMLDSFNIKHTGTFLDVAERDSTYPLIIEKNNFKLAMLNYTYGTNGLTVDEPYIVNRIDTAQIHNDLDKAKLASPDYIFVTIHWGIEYERNENATQQKLADFIFRKGADAIIGSHPHVVQPIKFLEIKSGDSIIKRPVFYSMGNFVSNQRAQYKDGGVMAEIHLSKSGDKTQLDSAAYLPYWVYRSDKNEKSTFYVIPVSKFECGFVPEDFDDNALWSFRRFAKDTREHLKDSKESDFYTK